MKLPFRCLLSHPSRRWLATTHAIHGSRLSTRASFTSTLFDEKAEWLAFYPHGEIALSGRVSKRFLWECHRYAPDLGEPNCSAKFLLENPGLGRISDGRWFATLIAKPGRQFNRPGKHVTSEIESTARGLEIGRVPSVGSLQRELGSMRIGFFLLASFASLFACDRAMAQLQVEAIAGTPFGLAKVVIPMNAADQYLLETGGVAISDAESRLFYPVFSSSGAARRVLGELTGETVAAGGPATAYFLFKGDRPLDVTIKTSRVMRFQVAPRVLRRNAANRLWRSWWREFNAELRVQTANGDYPPVIENYLASMLGARLGLDPPLISRMTQDDKSEFQKSLDLLMGTEDYRFALMRDSMLGRGLGEQAIQPMPPRGIEPVHRIPQLAEDVEIEPIASHVPDECFYVRFGTWANQMWLQKLTKEHGGDLGRMISLRGQDAHLMERMNSQLVIQQTKLAEMLGGTVIEDVAFIGRDLFMREGAAIGVVLHAKTNLLGLTLSQQRRDELAKNQDATLEEIEIAGHKVSFLSTADNRIRSFYAVDGKFHLTTNSREIVKRFFEAGQGVRSLAQLEEFRLARIRLPFSNDYTLFAFMSSRFLSGMLSPGYQIELRRRLMAVTDIELSQLAKMAARHERVDSNSIPAMVNAGLLPRGFGHRADGSGPVVKGDEIQDSMRGKRGFFLPIPDVKLTHISPYEAATFGVGGVENIVAPRFDPIMLGVRRYKLNDEGLERLVIDAEVAPFGEEKYGWLTSMLGPPLQQEIVSGNPKDIATLQASVKGGLLFGTVGPHQLFAVVQDDRPPQTDLRPTGFQKSLEILRTTPGYLGAWPKPGFLDVLPLLVGPPDPAGFSSSILGFSRWQGNGFSVIAADRNRLAHVAPMLRPVVTTSPAQIRIRVGDVAHSNLYDWLNGLNYMRARQTCMGNTRLMNTVVQQLNVPVDDAHEAIERLLDVEVKCALGGEYELVELANGSKQWRSDQWSDTFPLRMPQDYQAPLLGWFRGLNAALNKEANQMVVNIQLDLQRAADEPAVTLPSFDLFGFKSKE